MAKYIVNIILVTACLFTYTSCIRKMNLYDENRNTGQDNNEKDTDSTPVYMYPFDKETANVTAEIIIHTKKEIQTKDINVEIPLNPEKPYVPLNKNDAFQKVQKRRVQKKR